MPRILILGNGGAGKTWFAHQLRQKLNIKIIHLDALYWKEGWQHTSKEVWEKSLQNAMEGQHWIMEGTQMRDLELRMIAADQIIFLDTPRSICLWRIFKKGLVRNTTTRLPDGCPIRGISWRSLKWVYFFPIRHKPKIFELIKKLKKTWIKLID
ncbi:MAG: topology modulation protein [Gammaproteobacteria bacterium]